MQIIRTINVNASADHLWEIVGNNFNNVADWTSQVISSEGNPNLPEGSGRVCQVSGGEIVETFTNFSDTDRQFSYDAESKMFPFFVRTISNSWSVKADGPNKSTVHMHMQATLTPILSLIMGPVMKRQTAKSVDIILEEVKYYAETGQILSP